MSTSHIQWTKSRFVIRRKDVTIDDVVLETDGLTLGRLITNDVVLNHRTVSRTHAGIKEFNGEFWLFNLSGTNGTLLNGELVDKAPLADGDVIQIGRYLLQINYLPKALALTVEMEMEAHPVEGRTATLHGGDESQAATQMLVRPGQETVTPGGTRRLEGTGLLTGLLPGLDEQALNVFWEKRKREAGKIAARTALHPKGERRVGKAQFNWRPTFDLRKPWRKSYFMWGALIVGGLAILALFLHDDAYSPGELSAVHAASTLSGRQIAVKPNDGSCYDCHTVTASIDDNCARCHTTQAFTPVVSDPHERAGVGCINCHGEHMGSDFRPAGLGSAMCVSCHNDTYIFQGRKLGTPHGGEVGYPVVNGNWQWHGLTELEWRKQGLPDDPSRYTPPQQFHLIHVAGQAEGRANCTDCHSAGLNTEEGLHQSPRATCASCHGTTFTAAGQTAAPNCVTCHAQHGEQRNQVASLRRAGDDGAQAGTNGAGNGPVTARNLAFVGVGGAQVIRHDEDSRKWSLVRESTYGGLPWWGWAALIGAVPVIGLAVAAFGTVRRRSAIAAAQAVARPAAEAEPEGSRLVTRAVAEAPEFPHPVVDPLLCIGCHACVEACPHDVLAIVNGVSTPVAIDQCMEDTGCTVECPTSPKACIVINTTKKIPPRKVPQRDQRFMTNVHGIYMAGDVSGVPLIKNAINEGAAVIDYIIEDLRSEGADGKAEYDVAIIGIGPAGLSATAIAKQRGLRYVAIEQDKVVSTIQNYPAGKYVFFKPDTVEARGLLWLQGAGSQREQILQSWTQSMMQHGLQINEEESCKDIKREDGLFRVITERGKLKEKAEYTARAVILAIGNRGTPMRLRVPGEDLKILVQPDPRAAACRKCGAARRPNMVFCPACGAKLLAPQTEPYWDSKVKYKLSDPDDYSGKNCIVVGAGNSAIEAAVDLTGFRRDGNKISFTRDNQVTLVVRSDFKGDLKLGNKMNVYDCMDAGRIKVYFRAEIKEIKENEVILMKTRTKEELARLPNDYVFALIGGEKPTKFLESIGVRIG